MAETHGDTRRQYVRRMFGRIAPRYDLLNRLMTFGQDQRWRHDLVAAATIPANAVILDLGTGTGDLALEIQMRHPDALVVAADLTPEMMQIGKTRHPDAQLQWVLADADHLPFPPDCFDNIVSGFLLRNLGNLPHALREQQRVLKADGDWHALDTTPPADNLLQPFIRFYLHVIVPLLGFIIAGDRAAYEYLPETTEHFLQPDALLDRLGTAGFHDASAQARMFGTVAIYHARKPQLLP